MSFSNYPFNQDTAFNSLIITDNNVVLGTLGQTYSQAELIPINYQKLITAFDSAVITYLPIKNYSYISASNSIARINDEETYAVQGTNTAEALSALKSYWKNNLITDFEIVLGVVSNISESVHQNSGGVGAFHVEFKCQVTWFIATKNPYA